MTVIRTCFLFVVLVVRNGERGRRGERVPQYNQIWTGCFDKEMIRDFRGFWQL